MPRARRWTAAGLALLFGCQPGPEPAASTPPARDAFEVRLTCGHEDPEAPCTFRPAEVTIAPGGTVRWVNDDATFHTVTSSAKPDVRVPDGRFDAVLDEPGETFSRIFADAGTFPYYCQPHAEFMVGIVRVVEP